MSALRRVSGLLGMSAETLRVWQRRSEVDAGERPGTTSEVLEENRRLKRENTELRKANEIRVDPDGGVATRSEPATRRELRTARDFASTKKPTATGPATSGWRGTVNRASFARSSSRPTPTSC